ncbi:facilitated trehalose transporter Tret1 [Trichonephila clavipes]|nr:facilitated trehalose transporter Tret1 [Trichonephila clavipes]
MEERNRDVQKLRSASTTSSTSSITEYVNQVFTESELGLSRGVSIHISEDTQYVENPLNSIPYYEKEKTNLDNVVDFTHDSQELDVSILTHVKNMRKMYVAALVVLMFPVCMGITATYSATATMDMKKVHSSIHPTSDQVTWIGSLMAIGALIGGTAGGTNLLF